VKNHSFTQASQPRLAAIVGTFIFSIREDGLAKLRPSGPIHIGY